MNGVAGMQRFPRWLLISFFVETILILVGGYVLLHITERRYRSDAEAQILAVAQLKSKQIADWRADRLADGYEIMNSPYLIRGISQWMKTRNEDIGQGFTRRFSDLRRTKAFEDVLLVDSTGEIIFSFLGATGRPDDEVIASLAVAARENIPQVTDLHISALRKSPRMDITVPLALNPDSRSYFGSVVLVIDPERFLYPLIQSWPIPSRTSETILIRREGDHVVFLNNLSRLSKPALTFTFPLTSVHLPAVRAVLGTRGIFEGKDYRGVDVISALDQIHDSPWFMVSKVDREEAFEGMWIQNLLIYLLTLGLLAAGSAVTVVFWQQEQKTKQRNAYEAEIAQLALKKNFEYRIRYANDIIFLADEALRIVEANDRALEAYGYAREEMLQLTLDQIVAPVSQPAFREKSEAIWETGSCLAEMIHRRKDGSEFPVEISARTMSVESTRYIQTIIRDITERKRAEGLLAEKEKLYRTLFNLSPAGILLADSGGNILEVNDALCKNLGYSHAELIGKNVRFLVPVEFHDGVAANLARVVNGGNLQHEVVNIDKNGQMRRMELRESSIVLPGGQTGILTVSTDITERTATEEALKRSEELHRDIFDYAPVGIYQSSPDGGFLTANPRLAEILGYPSLAELMQRNMGTDIYWDPKERAALIARYEPLGSVFDLEVRWKKKDGTSIWISLNSHAVKDATGKTVHFEGFVQDITGRKQAEEALQQNEVRLRQSQRVANVGHYTYDIVSGSWSSSEMLDEIFGIGPDFVRDFNGWLGIVHPDDREDMVDYFSRQILAEHQPFDREYRIVRRLDHAVRWVHGVGNLEFSGDGTVVRMFGIIQDVTERRRVHEHSEMLAHALRSISECVCVTDMDDRLMFVNDGFCKTYGYEPQELLGKNVAIVVSPNADARQISTVLQKTREGGWYGEMLNVRKNGEEFPVQLSTSAIRNREGACVALVGVAEDITLRKRAEEDRIAAQKALKESEQQFRSLFVNATLGIYRTTPDGKILLANPALIAMLGYSSFEELSANNLEAENFAPRYPREHFRNEIETNGEIRGWESAWKRKDGTSMYLVESARLVRDDEGNTLYYEGIVEDITEKKSLEQQFLHMQRMESIGTLAGGIAHDFNNILGIIMGHTSLLARLPHGAPQFLHSIDAITKATQRGASLVKQMLTFARKTEVILEPLQVNSIVVETARLIRETFPKTVIVTEDLAVDLPWVVADSTQLHQVLLNLCVNARDAMPAGGTLSISTSTVGPELLPLQHRQNKSGEFVFLRVADSGMGMDEATKQKIFEPFFTTKGPGQGTGLGLSLVYGIIANHNGIIDVESELGKGTTFNIYLPVQQRDLVLEADTRKPSEDVRGGKETILLIEDEDLLSDMLKVELSNRGYTVLVARDGEEGVATFAAHRNKIDVVISDLGLPKLGGEEVFARIRTINAGARVVLASGFIEPGRKSALEKAGVMHFVQKPYGPDEILATIRKVIDSAI